MKNIMLYKLHANTKFSIEKEQQVYFML